jgi:hypothetical protein
MIAAALLITLLPRPLLLLTGISVTALLLLSALALLHLHPPRREKSREEPTLSETLYVDLPSISSSTSFRLAANSDRKAGVVNARSVGAIG